MSSSLRFQKNAPQPSCANGPSPPRSPPSAPAYPKPEATTPAASPSAAMTTSAKFSPDEICADAAATRAHAARHLPHFRPGTILHLHGPLGAGKSEWVRGLAHALNIPGEIPSPTFTLCQPLPGGLLPLEHWDLYRLENARDWDSLGWPDCLITSGLVAVEWPERYPGVWPKNTYDLQITPQPNGSRLLSWL